MTMYRGSKSFGGDKKKEKGVLRKAVLTFLMTGVVAWPSFSPVYAATATDLTRSDGGKTIVSNNVHDVYVGKMSGDNKTGVNVFQKFDVKAGDIANLRFNEYGKTTHANNLLNMVGAKIDISGTVNALRDNKIGGNLYFLSSQGMVVGAGGAINAGALTVMTPTENYMTKITGNLETGVQTFMADQAANTVPLNSSGSIVINGTIRTATGAALQAANITVGETADVTAVIKSGVDFSNVVNTDSIQESDLGTLRMVTLKDADGKETLVLRNAKGEAPDSDGMGDITIAASVDQANISTNKILNYIKATTETDTTNATALMNVIKGGENANDTASAKVAVGQKAEISSLGDANLTAKATANENGENPKMFAFAEADVKVEGNVTAGGSVNITADASAVSTANDVGDFWTTLTVNTYYTNILGNKMLELLGFDPDDMLDNIFKALADVPDFFKSANIAFSMVDSKANVTVAEDSKVDAGSDVNVGANAISSADMLTNLKLAEESSAVALTSFDWENVVADAKVDVQGLVTGGSEGTVNVIAEAKNGAVINNIVTGIEDILDGHKDKSNAAFNILSQNNRANVTVGSTTNTGELVRGKNVNVKANSVYSTEVAAMAKENKNAYSNSTFNQVLASSEALVDVYGDMTANGGTMAVDATSFNSRLHVTSNNSLAENLVNLFGKSKDVVKRTGGNNSKFIADVTKEVSDDADADVDGNMEGDDGYSLDNYSYESVVYGAATAVLKVKNAAKVNIRKTAKLTSGGDYADEDNNIIPAMSITANAVVRDLFVNVVDIVNTPFYENGVEKVISGATAFLQLDNESSVLVEAGTEAQHAQLNTKGTLNINAVSSYLADRCDSMKEDIFGVAQVMKATLISYRDYLANTFPSIKDKVDAIDLSDKALGFDELSRLAKMDATAESDDEDFDFESAYTEAVEAFEENAKDLMDKLQAEADKVGKDNEFVKNTKETWELQTGGLTNAHDNFKNGSDTQVSVTNDYKADQLLPSDGYAGNVLIENIKNKALTIIGRTAELSGDNGVNVGAQTVENNKFKVGENQAGKSLSKGIGGSVFVGFNDSYATVLVSESAQLKSLYGGVNVLADNALDNSSEVNGGGKPIKTSVIGMVSYMGGHSIALSSVDDEAKIIAGRDFDVKAANDTSLFATVGGSSETGGTSIGASVAVNKYDTDTVAIIADNDYDRNISTKLAEKGHREEEDKAVDYGALLKLALTDAVYKEQSGRKATLVDGKFEALNLHIGADTSGLIFALSTAGNAVTDKTGFLWDKLGLNLPNKYDPKLFTPADAPAGSKSPVNGDNGSDNSSTNNNLNLNGEDNNLNILNPGSQEKVGTYIAGSGSVSWNAIKGKTVAFSDVDVTLHGEKEKGGNIAVKAGDTVLIAALSGATASATKNFGENKFNATLEGAVGHNKVTKRTLAEIYGAELHGVNNLDNSAINGGVQLAAGWNMGKVSVINTSTPGVTLGASVSLNYVDSAAHAKLIDVTVKDNAENTVVNNIASDYDIQIAGGVSIEKFTGTVGLGAGVTIANVKNDIAAVVQGGTYDVKSFTNLANSRLIQVGTAVSVGFSKEVVGGKAAVALNSLENKVNAEVSDSVISAYTFRDEASDGRLSEGTNENTYVKTLKDMGFDVDGQEIINMANNTDSQSELTEDSRQKLQEGNGLEDDRYFETDGDGKQTNNLGQEQDLKYTTTKYSVDNAGNKLIGAAVLLSLNLKKEGTDVNAGGAVVRNSVDNDFTATVDGSTISGKGNKGGNSVDVKAKSDSFVLGGAAGISIGIGKTGAQAAGSVSLQYMDNDTVAKIVDSEVKSDSIAISGITTSNMLSIAGIGAGSGGNAALGMTWAKTSLANITGAYATGVNFSGVGNAGVDITLDANNDSTFKTIAVTAAAGGIKKVGVNASGSVAFTKGENSTEAIMDSDDEHQSKITNGKRVKLAATNRTNEMTIAGGLTVGGTSVAAGGAYAESRIGLSDKAQQTVASIRNSVVDMFDNTSVISLTADDRSKVDTFSVVAGVGFSSYASVNGAVANTKLYQNVESSLDNTTVDAETKKNNAAVTLTAFNKIDMLTSADAASVAAGKAAGVAAGVGVSLLTSEINTEASIKGANQKTLPQYLRQADLRATSENSLLNVGIGVGVGAGTTLGVAATANAATNKLKNDTIALIDYADMQVTNGVTLAADSKEILRNYIGSLSAGAAGTAGVGVGATVALNEIQDITRAAVTNSNLKVGRTGSDALKITAAGDHRLTNLVLGVAGGFAGTAGVGVGAVVNLNTIGGETIAELVDSDVENAASDGDITVQATDEMTVKSHLGSLSLGGGGTAGVAAGAGVNVDKYQRDTKAIVQGKKGRITVNGGALTVKADSKTDITQSNSVVGAAVGGMVGATANSGVSVVKMTGETTAEVNNVTGQNTRLAIQALHNDKFYMLGVGGAVAAGLYGGAVAVNVYNLRNATMTNVLMDNVTFTGAYGGGEDLIEAKADSDVTQKQLNVSAAAALGGAVGVSVFNNNFEQLVGTTIANSNLYKDDARGNGMSVLAENNVTQSLKGLQVAAGVGGVGVTVGSNTINTATLAQITNSKVRDGSIAVDAKENLDVYNWLQTYAVGGISVGVSSLHNNFGSGILDKYMVEYQDGGSTKTKTADTTGIQDYVEQGYTTEKAVIDSLYGKDENGKYMNNGQLWNASGVSADVVKSGETMMYTGNKSTVAGKKGLASGLNVEVWESTLTAETGNIDVKASKNIQAQADLMGANVGAVAVGVVSDRMAYDQDINVDVKKASLVSKEGNINVTGGVSGDLINEGTQVCGAAIGVAVNDTATTRTGSMEITVSDTNLTALKGDINLTGSDTLGISNKLEAVNAGALNVSVMTSKVTDSVDLKVLVEKNGDRGNLTAGNNIDISATVAPKLASVIKSTTAGLVGGSGSNSKVTRTGDVLTTVGSSIKLTGLNIDIGSNVLAPLDDEGNLVGYNVKSYVDALGAGLVSVAVNDSVTKVTGNVKTMVGNVEIVGSKNLNVSTFGGLAVSNEIKGTTIGGVFATGTNRVENEKNMTVVADLTLQNGTTLGSLNILAASGDSITLLADGNGGGIVGISPVAASIDNRVTNNTNAHFKVANNDTINASGDVAIEATHLANMDVQTDGFQASVIGGSGTQVKNYVVDNTDVTVENATIKTKGKVYVDASASVNLNSEDDKNILRSSGVGGLVNGKSSDVDSSFNITNAVKLNNAKIFADKTILVGAYTEGNIHVNDHVQSSGAFGVTTSTLKSDIKVDDLVDIIDSELRTEKDEADIDIIAVDKLEGATKGYSELTAGVAGGAMSKVTNVLERNNKINITASAANKTKLHSTRDINFRANRDENGVDGEMEWQLRSELYSGSLVPANDILDGTTLDNTMRQNNQITVGANVVSESIRHTNFYAANGREGIKKNVGSYTMYGNDNDANYVSTSKGNIKDAGIVRNNFVNVEGKVTAGVANVLTINIGDVSGTIVMQDAAYKKLVTGNDGNTNSQGMTVYTYEEKGNFINFGDTGETAKIVGLADSNGAVVGDKFKIGSMDYSTKLQNRLDELEILRREYEIEGKGDKSLFQQIAAEMERIKGLMKQMGVSGGEGNTPATVDYIEIPDLVASGGNIVVDTGDLKGSGNMEAKGNPVVTINNYTNLMLVTNKIIVDDPGGQVIFNGVDINAGTVDGNKTLVNNNNATENLANIPFITAALGTAANIKITSYMDSFNYAGGKFTYDGGEDDLPAGTFNPKADIEINGDINSLKGDVHIENRHHSITIEGKTANDSVTVSGKTVTIAAPKGNVTQGFTDGIVNIGGDVQSQYAGYYNDGKNALKDGNGTRTYSLITRSMRDGEKADPNAVQGGWIAGGQVYINASDININGNIQSGFPEYTLNLTDGAERNVETVRSNWLRNNSPKLTDSQVLNGGSAYRISEGGMVWSAEKQCFVYVMEAFYRPDTDTVLVPGVGASGGRIYLTGRISSTGNGRVMCLDGAYDITVNSQVPHNIQLAGLEVNEVKGQVVVADSASYERTVYTTDGAVKERMNDQGQYVKVGDIAGPGRNYEYRPQSGLTYNWITGFSKEDYTLYSKSMMAKWWGASSYKDQESAILDEWSVEENRKETHSGADTRRKDGSYITNNNGVSQQAGFVVEHTTKETGLYYVKTGERHWSTGLYGCHKWVEYTWKQTKATTQHDAASVKADNPISIVFVGKNANDSVVSISSTSNNKDVILTGNVGNSQVYSGAEKGKVVINSAGSIIQSGGSVYGAEVALQANGSISNFNIVSGKNLTLNALTNGRAAVNVNVTGNRGVTAADSRVEVGTFGGERATLASLTADGSIVSANGSAFGGKSVLVAGDRVDLVSKSGSIGASGKALNVRSGQDANATDTLSASVNAQADGGIYLNQDQGDMRMGTIWSKNGDLEITVANGGIVDALPYVEMNGQEENDLISQWVALGLVDDGSEHAKEVIAEKNAYLKAQKEKLLAERDGTSEARKAEIDKELSDITTGKDNLAKEFDSKIAITQKAKDGFEADLLVVNANISDANTRKEQLNAEYAAATTEAEKAVIQEKIDIVTAEIDLLGKEKTSIESKIIKSGDEITKLGGEKTTALSNYDNQYKGKKDALNVEKNKQGASADRKAQIDKELAAMPDEYRVWDENQLLFAIQDTVINPKAGVNSSAKNPNLYGKNITLKVQNNAGLNDSVSTVIDLATLGERDANGKLVHLNDLKMLSQADAATVKWDATNGKATINKKLAIGFNQTSGGTLTVTNPSGSNVANNVYVEGRVFHNNEFSNQNVDTIINAVKADGNVRITSLGALTGNGVINARDLVLLVGDATKDPFSIGTNTNFLNVNITGILTATATGNIYLKATNDLNIASISAGSQGDYGYINLKAGGNIYGTYVENQGLQGYIRSEQDKDITLEAGGSIGSKDDDKKTVRVKNGKTGVVNLTAGKEIVVEGVSSANGRTAGGMSYQAPEGSLTLNNVSSGTGYLDARSNGALTLSQDVEFTDNGKVKSGSVVKLQAADVNLAKKVEAETVELVGYTAFNQDKNSAIIGKNVTLTVGQMPTNLTFGGQVDISLEKLQGATAKQKYTAEDQTGDKLYGDDAKIWADNLTVKGTGLVDLGSTNNKLHIVNADVDSGLTLVTGNLSGLDAVLGTTGVDNGDTEVTINCAENDMVGGSVDIAAYAFKKSGTNGLKVNGSIYATGNITLYTDNKNLILEGKDDVLSAEGMLILCANDKLSNEKILRGKEGIGLIAKGDIENTAGLVVVDGEHAGAGLYLESLEGNIKNGAFAGKTGTSESYVNGSIELVALNGTIDNSSGFFAEGDITLEAKNSITNTKGFVSNNGDITLYTVGEGEGEGEGILLNQAQLKTANGAVFLYADKYVENNAIIEAGIKDGETKEGAGTVTIVTNGIIINELDTGEHSEETQEYIHGARGVAMVSGAGLYNNAAIWADNGDVTLVGAGAYDGQGSEFLDETKQSGMVINTGDIYARSGDVNLAANSYLWNTGSMFANGEITLYSAERDVINMDDLKQGGDGSASSGKIVLEAENGSVYNEQDLTAGKGIAIRSKNDLENVKYTLVNTSDLDLSKATDEDVLKAITEQKIKFEPVTGENKFFNLTTVTGDIEMTSTNGYVKNSANVWITGTEGDGGTSQGNIILHGKGDVTNNGSAYSVKGDLRFTSDDGKVVNSDTGAKKQQVSGEDVQYVNGNIIFKAEKGGITNNYSLYATKDIELLAKDSMTIASGKNLVSEQGHVLIHVFDASAADKGILTNGANIEAMDGYVSLSANKIVNNSSIRAGKESSNDELAGKVMLTSITDLTNGDPLTEAAGEVIYGVTGVSMVVGHDLVNAATIKADNGDVVLAGLSEQSVGSVDNSGNITVITEGHITLAVLGDLINSGTLSTAKGDIDLDADGALSNIGTLTASNGNVELLAGDTMTNSGNIMAIGGIADLDAGGALSNSGAITATGEVNIMAGGNVANTVDTEGDKISSTGANVFIYSDNGSITNSSELSAATDVELYAEESITNTKTITAKNGSVIMSAWGNITNGATGVTESAGVAVTAGTDVIVSAGGTLINYANITAGTDDTEGTTAKVQHGNVLLGFELYTFGGWLGEEIPEGVELSEIGNVINDGSIQTTNGDIEISSGANLTNGTGAHLTINGTGDVDMLAVGDLTNNGVVQTGNGDIGIVAGGNLTNASGADLIVQGTGDVSLLAIGNLTNAGDILIGTSVVYENITTPKTAEGTTKNDNLGSLIITAGGEVNNSGNMLLTSGDILIDAEGDTINSGNIIIWNGEVKKDTNGNFAGFTSTGFVLIDSASDTINTGNIYVCGDGSIDVDATDNVYNGVNDGTTATDTDAAMVVYGAGAVSLDAGGSVTNLDDLAVEFGVVELMADKDIISSGDIILEQGDVALIAKDKVTNTGNVKIGTVGEGNALVSGGGDITIMSGGVFDTTDDLVNSGSIETYAGDVELTSFGDVANSGNVTVTKDGDVAIVAGGNLKNTIPESGDFTDGIIIGGKGDIAVTAQGKVVNSSNMSIGEAGNIILSSASTEVADNAYALENQGGFIGTGDGDVVIGAVGNVKNAGNVIIGTIKEESAGASGLNYGGRGEVLVASEEGSLENTGNMMTVQGEVNLLAQDEVYNSGSVYTRQGDVRVESETSYLMSEAISNSEFDAAIAALNNYFKLTGSSQITLDKGILTEHGNVDLIAHAGTDITSHVTDAQHDLTNVALLNTASIYAYNGKVTINAVNGDLYNTDDLLKNGENVTYNEGGDIEILALQGSLTNTQRLETTGNITLKSKKDLLNDTTQGIGAGKNVLIESTDGTVTNNSFIYAKEGNVVIKAKGDVTNSKSIYVQKAGDVLITSEDGFVKNVGTSEAVVDKANIFTTKGNITLTAGGTTEGHRDVENSGDMFAMKGMITFNSAHGNVTNSDDLAYDVSVLTQAATNTYSGTDENARVTALKDAMATAIGSDAAFGFMRGTNATDVMYANGSITMTALEGSISNTKSLFARGDILLEAKNSIATTAEYGFNTYGGDITLISHEGVIINGGTMNAVNGDILLKAEGSVPISGDALTALSGFGTEVRTEHHYSVYNAGDLHAENGSIVIDAAKTVENLGDMSATVGKAIVKGASVTDVNTFAEFAVKGTGENGAVTENDKQKFNSVHNLVDAEKGDVKVWSGSLDIHDTKVGEDIYAYSDNLAKNTAAAHHHELYADGEMIMKAKDGMVYLDKDINAVGDVDLVFGVTVIASHAITSQTGDVNITTTRGDLAVASNVTAAENINLNSAGSLDVGEFTYKGQRYVSGSLNAGEDINMQAEGYIHGELDLQGTDITGVSQKADINLKGNINSKGLTRLVTLTEDKGGSIKVDGNIVSQGDIDAGAYNGGVTINNITAKGMAAMGSHRGNVEVGNAKGAEVVLYTENQDASVNFENIEVGKMLVLAADTINSNTIDMTHIYGDDYDLRVYGAGGQSTGKVTLDFRNIFDDNVKIQDLFGSEVTLLAGDRPVEIGKVSISDRADIYAMGTKTSIFGKVHEYDESADVIYYNNGGGDVGIDLSTLFFDDDDKKSVIDEVRNHVENFEIGNNTGSHGYDEMSFAQTSRYNQNYEGILLKLRRDYRSYNQRYSLESLMQNLLSINVGSVFNATFNNDIQFFNRYDNVAIPDVVVNTPEEWDKDQFQF